jgi:uncharacterized protein
VPADPFVLSVAELVNKPGESKKIHLEVPAPVAYGEAVARVAKGEPLVLDLLIESVHEGLWVSGTVSTVAHAECVRCLDPASVEITGTIEELFAYLPDDSYDYQVVQETIDLNQVVLDQVVCELPFQPVCSPDCPGLDPKTGLKRVPGDDDAEQVPIDPRWESLSRLKLPENPSD